MVKITYFVHGTTTDNEKDIFSGQNDVSLSELGIQQSKDLPGQIGDKRFEAVYCSDLKRAVDSAHLSFEGMCPIISDPRLRECACGSYDGAPWVEFEAVQHDHIHKAWPGGESYQDVQARMEGFLADLKKMHDGDSIAIVAHQAPQLALEVILWGKTWEQAFSEDWRKKKAWQPGWEFVLE